MSDRSRDGIRYDFMPRIYNLILVAELHARANVAPYLRKCGNLPIRESLVITSPYARLTVRSHHRHTNVK